MSCVCLQNKGYSSNVVSSDVSETRLSGNIHVLLEIKQVVNPWKYKIFAEILWQDGKKVVPLPTLITK